MSIVQLPLITATDSTPFAFLIHFRKEIRKDLACYHPRLEAIPEFICRGVFEGTNMPALKWGGVMDDVMGRELGSNQLIPLSAETMIRRNPPKARRKIESTLDKLVRKGVGIVGLGALTAPLMKGGLLLRNRKDIGVTNGNAFTAVIMYEAVVKLLVRNPDLSRRVAIVGASGSVGSCLARQLVRRGGVDEVLLIARNVPRLERLRKELKGINPAVRLTIGNDIADIRSAQLTVLLTASTDTLVQSEHLCPDAVVLDGTQPRNTSPSLLLDRPDVTVIDGGIVKADGIGLSGGGLGLPSHHYFACFSECVLLSLDGHRDHFSIGNPTLEHVDHITAVAHRFQHYGFQLAPFLSFGKPLVSPYNT
ncbi:MAG: hypothetical protein P8M07_09325 [Flavobacteriales bacterium]|nr:hypothetical protein [Flavobacteriales bacterium]